MSTATANSVLDAIGNNISFSEAAVWVQLHTADPGSAGTTSVATETTRQSASFASAAGGSISTDADVVWTSIAGSQDATHFTLWDASTAGNFIGSGTITANAYTAGDTFTIPSGDLTLSLTVAS
jgi:hypothetical protein